MENAQSTFDYRCEEIKIYMDFIIELEQKDQHILEKKNPSDTISISNDVKKILKSNVYLLLYNLVESTVRNTLQAIYNHLQSEEVTFNEVCDKLQLEILKNFNKHLSKTDVSNFHHKTHDISKDMIYNTFDSKNLFNGNVDAKRIREIAEQMGINLRADDKSRNGYDLLSVKSQRNSLAHGGISFCDCGKDLIANELNDVFDRVKIYLNSVIKCCEEYVQNKSYKK